MSEIEMPPEDVSAMGAQAHADRASVISFLIETAHTRTHERIGYVLQAVVDFENASDEHIKSHLKGFDENVEFSFGPVVDALIGAVGTALLPEAELAKSIFEAAAKTFTEGLAEAVDGAAAHGANAQERLTAGVKKLALEISTREGHAINDALPQIDPIVRNAMHDVEYPSMEHDWLNQMLTWMGFDEPTQEATYAPIRQWLEYEFVGLLARVQAEAELKHGVPGLDSGDINPELWAGDAQRAELDSYRHGHTEAEHEKAWSDTYKMSDE